MSACRCKYIGSQSLRTIRLINFIWIYRRRSNSRNASWQLSGVDPSLISPSTSPIAAHYLMEVGSPVMFTMPNVNPRVMALMRKMELVLGLYKAGTEKSADNTLFRWFPLPIFTVFLGEKTNPKSICAHEYCSVLLAIPWNLNIKAISTSQLNPLFHSQIPKHNPQHTQATPSHPENEAHHILFHSGCLCHRRTRRRFFLQALQTLGTARRTSEVQQKYDRNSPHGAIHRHTWYWFGDGPVSALLWPCWCQSQNSVAWGFLVIGSQVDISLSLTRSWWMTDGRLAIWRDHYISQGTTASGGPFRAWEKTATLVNPLWRRRRGEGLEASKMWQYPFQLGSMICKVGRARRQSKSIPHTSYVSI